MTSPADLNDADLLATLGASDRVPAVVLDAARAAFTRPNPFAALAEDDDLLLAQPPFQVDSCRDLSVLADSQAPRLADAPHARPAGANATTTLSTTEAAAILGVSRATLVRYCDDGRLPYMQPGRHRWLRLADVLAFKDATTHGGAAS